MAAPVDPVDWWVPTAGGIELAVRVTPGARGSEVLASSGGWLRVRVAAPAHEGKANLELARLLARLLDVRPAAVTIVRGERSRDKVVRVIGVDGIGSLATGARSASSPGKVRAGRPK